MIEKERVQHIAKLARIQLKESEVLQYQKDLSEILDYFDVLKEVNTSSVEPMTHSVLQAPHLLKKGVGQENIVREDIPRKEHPEVIKRLLSLAPALKQGFLKVKSVFTSL